MLCVMEMWLMLVLASSTCAGLRVSLGPRPYYLVQDMDPSDLKNQLIQCEYNQTVRNDFTVAHRGACMQFPEHSNESYHAAYRMGAGLLECDVTFTKDKELVCRHSQCDLHTTTDILVTPLAAKCSTPFTPAVYNNGTLSSPANATCCTSDITLVEFKTLQAKMDGYWEYAETAEQYVSGDGVANWRTTLYAARGQIMTHRESIQLFKQFGVKMIPELKKPLVEMPFDGFTGQEYAQKLIDEYLEAGVDPTRVFPQSFMQWAIDYWIQYDPLFGRQGVFLQQDNTAFRNAETWPNFHELKESGINIIAPPFWMLTDVIAGEASLSDYAVAIKESGLQVITWAFERSGSLYINGGGYYYQSLNGQNQADPLHPQPSVINNDGDMYTVIHVLAHELGVIGIFSDWSATINYYSNCLPVNTWNGGN